MNIYRHNQPFELERGGILPELTIAFSTYGKLNAAHDNVIWVCHALTADSHVYTAYQIYADKYPLLR